MKNFTLNCLMVLCLGIANSSIAQTPVTDSILSFQTMHVHFDKDIYLPGETVWFKAYMYNVNEISFAATNFYAAIYDEKGKLIYQKQYPVIEGSCNGDFEIPDTIESSRIQFRAFTKAMIADDSNNVYERILKVYNKGNNPEATVESKLKKLAFFPEGGQAIAELEDHIAFKASYEDGSPAMINGQIFALVGDKVVDTFFTDNRGMGKFILTPTPGERYFAIWKDENGFMQRTLLPVSRFGVSFHVELVNKNLQYSIARNKTSDNLSLLHLIARMGNYQVYKADLVIPNEMELSTAKFPIDSLPAGLMQLALFDKDWNKLQERSVFINSGETKAGLLVKRDTINGAPKGKNTIEISLADTMFTNLSVSIADINFYKEPNPYTIAQDLLLNTQVQIEPGANWPPQDGNSNFTDLSSLTHHWKKYDWQKIINKKAITQQSLDNYISLAVNYKQKNLALPQDDALNLIVTNNGMGKQFYNIKPESQTTFKKSGLLFFDSVKIAYSMDKNKEVVNYLSFQKEESIKIPPLINALPKEISFASTKNPEQNNLIEGFYATVHKKFNDVQTIKEVVVRSKYKGNPVLDRIDELDKFYATGMFGGTVRGYQLNVIDDSFGVATNHDLKDYIRYRIPGLQIHQGKFARVEKKMKENVVVDTLHLVRIFINEVDMTPETIKIEGLPAMTAGDPFEFIQLADVAYVKYVPGIVIGAGFSSSDGALYIYTKTGREKGPPVKGLPFVYIKGYNAQKEFNNPDYSDNTTLKQADLRTTVYWNPNVIMDKTNNTVKIEYFNNDISKKLLLKIEGVNAEGRLIYLEKILE
jgi:hypothetical protein